MMPLFEYDKLGEMDEYVGCKVIQSHTEKHIKLNQPVLIRSCNKKIELDKHRITTITSAEAGAELSKVEGTPLDNK